MRSAAETPRELVMNWQRLDVYRKHKKGPSLEINEGRDACSLG